MPELPAARRTRLIAEWGIKEDDARVLVNVPGLVDYTATAIASLKSGTAKDVVNWVRQDVLAYLNDTSGLSPALLTPEMLAELVDLVTDGAISRPQAKDVLDESLREDKWPRDIVEARGIAQVSDEGAIAEVVDDVIAANAGVVAEYRAGDEKTKKQKQGFLFGQIKRALGGDANPQIITKLLLDRLASG
jgi:aspartyl-tRNA(Asn)/glutamyl-tRNA(Gln) amidotransferase subunit B